MKKLLFINKGKTIYVDYEITANQNMYLKLTRNNTLLVTAPKNVSEKKVKAFVQEHLDTFVNHLSKQTEKLYSLEENTILFNGNKYVLNYLTGYKTSSYKISNKKIYLLTKEGSDVENDEAIKNMFKKETKKYIEKRQKYFEKLMHISVSHSIKYSFRHSTWGTNNIRTNSISYSTKLACFSNEVRDYVIVHELAHYFEHNHSKEFWKIVEKYIPKYKSIKKILNGYSE